MKSKNALHQANHKGFVSSRNIPSTLTGTQQRSFFCKHILGPRSQAAAAFVRRGGCANADVVSLVYGVLLTQASAVHCPFTG
jgi:hypothetical protein